MNQDFTVQKKSNICLKKKKFVQRVSPAKKIPAQATSEKKNSCNLKIPHPSHHFSNGPSLIFAIFKSSLNLNPIRHWSENWCPGYLEHALCSSEIHLAAAKSLEIIGHVTNCCKRPIHPPYISWFYLNQSNFFLGIIFSIKRFFKKWPKSRRGNCLVLPHASYGPGGESVRLPPMCPAFDSRSQRHIWVEFVVILYSTPRSFSPGTPAFSSPQKTTFPNSNSILDCMGISESNGLF